MGKTAGPGDPYLWGVKEKEKGKKTELSSSSGLSGGGISGNRE